jgi:hypothetical protein
VRHDQENSAAAKAFGGANWGRPSVVQPWVGFLRLYRRLYLRGPLLFLFVLAGLGGIVLGFRRKAWRQGRWGGLGLLPWLTGVALIVLPHDRRLQLPLRPGRRPGHLPGRGAFFHTRWQTAPSYRAFKKAVLARGSDPPYPPMRPSGAPSPGEAT